MKLVSYLKDEHDQLAMLENSLLYDTDLLHVELPSSMNMFLNFWDDNYSLALKIQQAIKDKLIGKEKGFPLEEAQLLAPVPFPASCRNAYTFKNENAINKHPHLSFANHHNIQGAGSIMCMPDYLDQLDFNPGIAVIISRLGRNIPAEEADEYIGGLMTMNIFSYGNLQTNEALSGYYSNENNFAIAAGPYLVTPDELEIFEVDTQENHVGKTWNLKITSKINDDQTGEASMNDMRFTFAELIEKASYGSTLFPGDIIFINTSRLNNKNHEAQWLKAGDVIETEIEGLGALINTIEKEESDFSLLKK